jgi:hypothetical protein
VLFRSDYVQLSALYPSRYGTFGVGYGGSSIEFHVPSYEVIVIGDETRYVASGEVAGKYANLAMLFAYAGQTNLGFLKDKVSLGGSLKLLSQDLSASGLGGGTASGMELNAGALYPLTDSLNFGVSVLNALPASLGGKIKWSTGLEESFPALLKAGLAYRFPQKQKLTATADYDRYLTRDLPGLCHFGVEWYPLDYVAVRAGLEQNHGADAAGATAVSNDLTYGLGFFFRGFRFDYAYHNYSDLSANVTNYFSLSYSPWREPTPEAVREPLKIVSPANGSVVNQETVQLRGIIADPAIKRVVVQGKEAAITDISFAADVGLALGNNVFSVEGYDKKGKAVAAFPFRLVRLLSFKDVDKDYWAKLPIEQLATLKIIGGYPDGTFRPEAMIVRAELATLLGKLKGELTPEAGGGKPLYRDVKPGHWARGYIEQGSRLKRSEERRVGKECRRLCRSRWSPYH